MKNLRDKTVVITGASSGIGRSAAVAFAGRGANVVVAARRVEKLGEVKEEIEALGARVLVVPTDVTAPGQMKRLVDATLEHFGQIDVFVNNAGAGLVGPFDELPMEEVRRLFDLNFFAAAEGMQLALVVMERQGWGTVINVSSLAGLLPSAYASIYNATKAALDALSESVAAEYLGSRISVVSFCPAMTHTEFFTSQKRMGSRQRWLPPKGAATSEWVAEQLVKAALRPRPLFALTPLAKPAIATRVLFPSLYFFFVKLLRDRT